MKIIHVENIVLDMGQVSAVIEEYSMTKSVVVVGGAWVEIGHAAAKIIIKALRTYHGATGEIAGIEMDSTLEGTLKRLLLLKAGLK